MRVFAIRISGTNVSNVKVKHTLVKVVNETQIFVDVLLERESQIGLFPSIIDEPEDSENADLIIARIDKSQIGKVIFGMSYAEFGTDTSDNVNQIEVISGTVYTMFEGPEDVNPEDEHRETDNIAECLDEWSGKIQAYMLKRIKERNLALKQLYNEVQDIV